MIEVTVRKDGITVSGHAGYADPGKDIVCAGVTALTQSLVSSMKELTVNDIEYEISPGKADIHYRDLSEAGKLLVDSFFIGICQPPKNQRENHELKVWLRDPMKGGEVDI